MRIFGIWEDLLLYSLLCQFKFIILNRVGLLFGENKQVEDITLGSCNGFLGTIFWHFRD